MQRESVEAPVIRPALFDRFEANSESTVKEDLVRQLADILSARRAYATLTSGVLGWGLPDVCNLMPSVQRDRDTVASYINEAIANFEPRLEDIHVTPIDDSLDFAFHLDARIVHQMESERISLRILTPLRGGGLGARVVRVEQSDFNGQEKGVD